MATRPARFTQGISTYVPRHLMGSFPVVPTPVQVSLTEDFLPFRQTDYTVTTAVSGTAVAFSQIGGAVKLATSASATDTIWLAKGNATGGFGAGFQFQAQNQMWMDTRMAYPRTVLNANDTNIYWGLFDNVVPTSASNGVYFIKPAGGTSVNFVIKKAGTVTTFQNVGDLSLPSGLYGDTNSVNATLNATVTGNAIAAVSVATAGSGYEWTPLILTTVTSGVAGNNAVSAMLGSTAFSTANPAVPVVTTGIPYASVAGTVITNPNASSYTNAGPVTTYLEVEPLLNYHFWYDGKGTLYVGVNGRQVMSIVGTQTGTGLVGIAAGGTATVTASNNSFYSTTQLSSLVSSFQPPVGSPINLVPLVPLGYGVGFANTTANIRSLYVDEFNVAVEIN